MAIQRNAVLLQLQADLLAIRIAAGFQYDVATVFIGNESLRQFNLSDLPLIIISDGADTFGSETFGNVNENDQKRTWLIKLVGLLPPGGSDDDIREQGEAFLSDIARQIFTVRRSNEYKALNVYQIHQLSWVGPNAFQTAESKQARVEIGLQLFYNFRPADV